jgi:hypothetical protein
LIPHNRSGYKFYENNIFRVKISNNYGFHDLFLKCWLQQLSTINWKTKKYHIVGTDFKIQSKNRKNRGKIANAHLHFHSLIWNPQSALFNKYYQNCERHALRNTKAIIAENQTKYVNSINWNNDGLSVIIIHSDGSVLHITQKSFMCLICSLYEYITSKLGFTGGNTVQFQNARASNNHTTWYLVIIQSNLPMQSPLLSQTCPCSHLY